MVFLCGRGREGARARGVREAAVLFGEGRGRIVWDHEPRVDAGAQAEEGWQALRSFRVEHTVDPAFGDRPDLGGRYRQEVEDEGERLPMKVPGALDPTVGKHYGVVRNGGELAAGYGRGVIPGVPCRPEDLGGAAQGISILDEVGRVAVGSHDGTAGEHPRDVAGAGELSRMGPQGVQFLPEDAVCAEQGLDGHRRGYIGCLQEYAQVLEGEQQHREHTVGAVDQGEAFFGSELQGSDAGARHGVESLDWFPTFQQQAFPHEAEADVGEGGEVPARAHGAVFGDGGGEARVEERNQGLYQFGTDARVARG